MEIIMSFNIKVEVSPKAFGEVLKFLDWGNSQKPEWLLRFSFNHKDESSSIEEVSIEMKINPGAFEPDITNLDESPIMRAQYHETNEQFEKRSKYQKEEKPKKNKQDYEKFKKILGLV